MKQLKTNRAAIAAALCATNTRTGQALASAVHSELQGLQLTPSAVVVLAQALCPAKTVLASLTDLRETIAQVQAFVGGLPAEFSAEQDRSASVVAACRARMAAIGEQINDLHRAHRSDEFSVMQPANTYRAWVAKGLSAAQIAAQGIPKPQISTNEEASAEYSRLAAKLEGDLAPLMAERAELQAFLNSGLDPRKAPVSLRGDWTSPLGDGALLQGLL